MKDRQPAKLADFKVGDMANGSGALDGHGRLGGGTGWHPQRWLRRPWSGRLQPRRYTQDLGKKFIAGEIKSIEGTRLTIARMDGQTQTIAVDETPRSRKKAKASPWPISRPGDHVFGPGQVKDGTFVRRQAHAGRYAPDAGRPEGSHGPDQK